MGSTLIATLVYGKKEFFNQYLFFLASLYQQGMLNNKKLSFLAVTDDVRPFELFPLDNLCFQTHQLSKDTLDDWRQGFTFRPKIKTLELASDIASKKGYERIVLMDTDLVALNDFSEEIERISPGNSLFQAKEGIISKGRPSGLRFVREKIQGREFSLKSGLFRFPESTVMYNSGVLGIHRENFDCIAPILELSDAVYRESGLWFAEQLAESYVLQQKTTIHTVSDDLVHYWYFKQFQVVVDQHLEALSKIERSERLSQSLPLSKLLSLKQVKSPWFRFKRELHKWGLLENYTGISSS